MRHVPAPKGAEDPLAAVVSVEVAEVVVDLVAGAVDGADTKPPLSYQFRPRY